MIRAVVFHKTRSGPKATMQYHFTEPQLEKINSDLEKFTRTGQPQSGLYDCYTGVLDEHRRESTKILIVFSELAYIG